MKRNSARGETLVEAMVSLAIFAVGLLGILGMNAMVSGQNGAARHETVASNLAHDLANAFQRLPYGHPAFTVGAHALGDAASYDDGSNAPLVGAATAISTIEGRDGSTYVVTWTVTQDTDADGKARGVVIDIDVSYPMGTSGTRKDLHLTTYRWNPAHLLGGPVA